MSTRQDTLNRPVVLVDEAVRPNGRIRHHETPENEDNKASNHARRYRLLAPRLARPVRLFGPVSAMRSRDGLATVHDAPAWMALSSRGQWGAMGSRTKSNSAAYLNISLRPGASLCGTLRPV